MDGLDQVTLVLVCILVLVALLFPLTDGRGRRRDDRHDGRPPQNSREQQDKRR